MIKFYEEIDRRLEEDGFYYEHNGDTYLSPRGNAEEHIEDAIGRYCQEMMIENTIVSETLFDSVAYEVGYVAVAYLDENGRPNLDTWIYEVK